MKVWTYAIFHNERPMLAYFLRHYTAFSEKVVLFDDHSDDGGPGLASAYANVEVRPYPGAGLDDQAFVDFAAETYKEARGLADWCCWVDADEFIYHHFLLMTLGRYMASGVTLPLIDGYAMWADHFPTTAGQIYDEVKTGTRYAPESKRCVFNPAIDIRWGVGKHNVEELRSAVPSQTAEIKLLHFRHLGREWFDGRNARNGARISDRNRANGAGWQVLPENHDKAGWHTQGGFASGQQVVA